MTHVYQQIQKFVRVNKNMKDVIIDILGEYRELKLACFRGELKEQHLGTGKEQRLSETVKLLRGCFLSLDTYFGFRSIQVQLGGVL
jgi:hypothetical protein